jgi:hypothetical protein
MRYEISDHSVETVRESLVNLNDLSSRLDRMAIFNELTPSNVLSITEDIRQMIMYIFRELPVIQPEEAT